MIFSLSLFFLLSLIFSFRQFFQLKAIKTHQVLIIAQSAFFWLVGIAQLMFFFDRISYAQLEIAVKSGLVAICSIFLTMVCLLAIRELTPKKVKTLWRIPILGILAGMYFEWKYIPFICLGYIVIAMIVLVKDRHRLRFLLKKSILMVILSAGIFLIHPGQILITNLVLIGLLLGIQPIVSLANIGSLFESKVEV